MKLKVAEQIFEKYSNTKFREKFVQWEARFSMLTDGRIDRERDMTKLMDRFRNFCERACNYMLNIVLPWGV